MEYLLKYTQNFKEGKSLKELRSKSKLTDEQLDVFCNNALFFGEKTMNYFDVNGMDFFKKSRKPLICFPKQVYRYQLVKENLTDFNSKKLTLTAYFFDVHHTTIIYSFNKIEQGRSLMRRLGNNQTELMPEAKQIEKALDFFNSDEKKPAQTYKEQFFEICKNLLNEFDMGVEEVIKTRKARRYKICFTSRLLLSKIIQKSIEQFGHPNYDLMQEYFKEIPADTIKRIYP